MIFGNYASNVIRGHSQVLQCAVQNETRPITVGNLGEI